MSDVIRFEFHDGTAVWLKAAPGAESTGSPTAPKPQQPDLPDGSADVAPVSRVQDSVRKAGHELAAAMRPLVPVLDSIHQTISRAESRPEEITVEMGVTLSGDLRLIVVNGSADATFTVTAKWSLDRD